jgi:pimeloyl-ACP methyl ester carboxylesterase
MLVKQTIHITFIHGISNKPAVDTLTTMWKDALAADLRGAGDDIDLDTLGITTSMIYWADVLYGDPISDAMLQVLERLESDPDGGAGGLAISNEDWRDELSGEERSFVEGIALKTLADVADPVLIGNIQVRDRLERIPIPWVIKRPLMACLLRDVHHYLFNKTFSPRPGVNYKVQEEIRSRVLSALNAVTADKHIVMSHSMGTVIIYDCLKRLQECPAIDGLMTIGSPLGLDEVQDKLSPQWTRENGFPEKLGGSWINVYDPLDVVAMFDGNLANDFKKSGKQTIEVIRESNHGAWRHDISKYLRMPLLRLALRKLIEE